MKKYKLEISKDSFLGWMVMIPIFLLGAHIGMIILNAYESFEKEMPVIFRITGCMSALWIIFSIILWVLIDRSNK